MAETVGYVNRARAFMPPGTVPPFITRFDAGSVAVGQLVFSSATRTQGELQDFALNSVRPLFATLPGVSAPPPFGGNQRTIVITLDPDKLQQYQDLAAGGDLGGQQGHAGDALRKYVDRRDQPHCKDERGARRKPFGAVEHAHPARVRHNGLPARHRNH